jgi:hypothetical protein
MNHEPSNVENGATQDQRLTDGAVVGFYEHADLNESSIDSPKTKIALVGMNQIWMHLHVSSQRPASQAET